MVNDNFKTSIESRLSITFREKIKQAATAETRLMITRLQQLVLRAGKRSRPRLLKLTYEAYGGKASDVLVDVGVALELHHQFLLVHDDIMDNDTIRYDGLNMLGFYRQDFPAAKTEIANSMALMAGNLLFTYANQIILDQPSLQPKQKIAILSLMHEANLGVHAGQQLDIVNVLALGPKLSAKKLLQTDYLKTALYSVRLPMQVAAELRKVDDSERRRIDEFAHAFGVLYQLVDDYSDYFVNDSSFDNHPKYRDYQQGKVTYPLFYALKHAKSYDVAYLKRQAGKKNLAGSAMKRVVEILENCGAQAASRKQIDEYQAQAKKCLAKLHIDAQSKADFLQMLDSFSI